MQICNSKKMTIRLWCGGFVPIWISTTELHIYDTCNSHEDIYGERYVDTTYRLQKHNFKR